MDSERKGVVKKQRKGVAKLVWATILLVIAIFLTILMVFYYSPLVLKSGEGFIPVVIMTVLWVGLIGAAVSGSHALLRSCRRKNKLGWFGITLYVVTFLPFWIFAGVLFLILMLIQGAKKAGSELCDGSSTNTKQDKPDYEIRDENGNRRTISYDKYVGQYRDTSGRVWKTDDGGKTFHLDK